MGKRRIAEILTGERMPVWMSLCVILISAVFAALGSYLIVPAINERLQIQQVRAGYLLKNITEINEGTVQLWEILTSIFQRALDENQISSAQKYAALTTLSRLQWRIIDLEVIMGAGEARQKVEAYRKAGDRLRRELEDVAAGSYDGVETMEFDEVFQAMEEFASASKWLLQELYSRAGFEVTVDRDSDTEGSNNGS